jgi:hypothetical protein
LSWYRAMVLLREREAHVDVTVGRTPAGRRDAGHELDGLGL